jgi:hypothetical protein
MLGKFSLGYARLSQVREGLFKICHVSLVRLF